MSDILERPGRANDDGAPLEHAALLGLARALKAHAPHAGDELAPWIAQAEAIAACTPNDVDAAFCDLRQRWLRAAHDAAHQHLRSPCAEDATRLPSGCNVAFGYERELDTGRLESQAERFAPPPPGWQAHHLLFSSGQSALSAVLMAANATAPDRALHVAHIGGYFETQELTKLFAADRIRADESDPAVASADLLIVEPVYLKGRFACLDVRRLAATLARHGCPPLIAVDATLTHLRFPMSEIAAIAPPGTTLMRISSLLKLDQMGFELANAGLLSLYGRMSEAGAGAVAERLARIRTTTGSGLGFADMCALDTPWILAPLQARLYADAVFAANARLAAALRGLCDVSHPALDGAPAPWAVAPYCVLRLGTGAAAAECHALADRIAAEAERRGILLRKGGSFGFRTHRLDVVEPEGEAPFLRLAMGAAVLSRDESIALIAEVLRAR